MWESPFSDIVESFSMFKRGYKDVMSLFALVQILDFGLARSTDAEMTGYVVTRWYRAPEVILNWMHYTQTGKTIVAVTYFYLRPRCWAFSSVTVTVVCHLKTICFQCNSYSTSWICKFYTVASSQNVLEYEQMSFWKIHLSPLNRSDITGFMFL